MSSSSSCSSDAESLSSTSPNPRKRQRRDNKDDAGPGNSAPSQTNSDTETAEEETPTLSHAAKRRQKKEEQKTTKGAASGTSARNLKRTVKTDGSAPSKRQNSIWVGNLSFKTTPASLRNFFEGVGEITRVHMPMKLAAGGSEGTRPRQENRGFAYVDFATPDAKVVAITLSENPLDGRRLLIKDGEDFNGRPTAALTSETNGAEAAATAKTAGLTKTARKILSVQKQPPGPTLFLGNLGFETTEDTIREMLASHRAKQPRPSESSAGDASDKWIRKIRLGTFEDSGKCKGWAFVDFTTPEHATAALTNPRNHRLNGRDLVVEYASPDAVRRGGGGGGGGGGGVARTNNNKPRKAEREEREQDNPPALSAGQKRKRPQPHTDDGNPAEGEVENTGGDDSTTTTDEKRGGTRGRGHGAPRGRSSTSKGDSAGRGRPSRTHARARPGAALALAKREDVSIVPSQGTKIVF